MPFNLPINFLLYMSAGFCLTTLLVAFWQIRRNQSDLKKHEKQIEQSVYESRILQEISERIGYELNIAKILDTIIESLDKLIPFSVVSYMLVSPDQESVVFRFHVQESVNRDYIDTIRGHMLDSLNQLVEGQYTLEQLKESATGTIIDEFSSEKAGSLWITPLLINHRGVGVLAVSSKASGLYHGSEMEILTKILAQANHAVNNLEYVISSEQKKMNEMVSSMVDGVLMLDRDFNLLVINGAAKTLLGLPAEDKISIFDIARSLADKVDLRAKIEESAQQDKVVVFDDLVVGNRISQIFISPVRDSKSQLEGSVVLFHDVTALKQLEQVRQDFTAMMVHELRAPLTVVRGTSDMILKKPEMVLQDQGKELLLMMEKSATTMLNLVNDLLDVAKIESGKFQILKTPGNLSEVIKERVAFFDQVAVSKGMKISWNLPESDILFTFDKERLSQVLNNLISNALKFSQSGGEIKVSAWEAKSPEDIKWRFGEQKLDASLLPSVVVCVTDSGAGIPPEDINNLFSKFKQLKVGVKNGEGTGLGLVIAKGIVESHDGQIMVESKVNEGTSFYFFLPQKKEKTLDN